MFEVGQSGYDALVRDAYVGFVTQLSRDLFARYPERFGLMGHDELYRYVESRIAYAARFEIEREDCIAELCFVEAEAMADFPRDHEDGWWRSILEGDGPEDQRIAVLKNRIEAVPPAPYPQGEML